MNMRLSIIESMVSTKENRLMEVSLKVTYKMASKKELGSITTLPTIDRTS